ncbi:short-chain dehydrogenase [Novimethylophilus kurashikiensis]|uniref:Short-chain dehydrogenase n=1 Tax=Novimethylophilus kurashikiensis TaxID=1825523 RepID=A0A2R5F1P6_9PROT|nr:SDR family oxidoreductase [Novimethylophilus kurashikiensis]GBG12606.1 short-chain dehydrogenase [Novimethylophilus kurashikiensis]
MQASPSIASLPSQSLAGKVALVTGGASGLGEALCRQLNEAGVHVAIADIQAEKARSLAQSLHGNGGDTLPMSFDISIPSAAEQAVEETMTRFGRLDVLINNAGTDKTLSMSELTTEDWLRVINTNLNGPFFLAKYASEHMKTAGSGHIINISSTAAKRCWPNASAYHASKWGLLGLSHAMHAELRQHNIKVTGVVVGGMRTPFLLDRFPDIDVSTLQDPMDAARAVLSVLTQASVIAEITILPMQETSWP